MLYELCEASGKPSTMVTAGKLVEHSCLVRSALLRCPRAARRRPRHPLPPTAACRRLPPPARPLPRGRQAAARGERRAASGGRRQATAGSGGRRRVAGRRRAARGQRRSAPERKACSENQVYASMECSTSFPGGNQVDGLPPASHFKGRNCLEIS